MRTDKLKDVRHLTGLFCFWVVVCVHVPLPAYAIQGLAATLTYGSGWYDTNVDLVLVDCQDNMKQHKIATGGCYGPTFSPDGRRVLPMPGVRSRLMYAVP